MLSHSFNEYILFSISDIFVICKQITLKMVIRTQCIQSLSDRVTTHSKLSCENSKKSYKIRKNEKNLPMTGVHMFFFFFYFREILFFCIILDTTYFEKNKHKCTKFYFWTLFAVMKYNTMHTQNLHTAAVRRNKFENDQKKLFFC